MVDNIHEATILVIDNDPLNLALISDLLQALYKVVKVASDGKKALKIAQSDSPPDIILLNIKIPKVDGYEVCKQLKANPSTQDIPIIFLTEKDTDVDEAYGLELGAVDYITKPVSPAIVLARVKTHLELKAMKDLLHRQSNTSFDSRTATHDAEMKVAKNATIHAMAYLSETRNYVTGNHILRTEYYVKILAEKLRFHPRFTHYLDNDNVIEWLFKTAPLHDIGNVGIPERILLKPGRLTPDEFEIIKSHTYLGHNVILQAEHELGIEVPFFKYAKEITYSHHERWDGSGYPDGIAGDSIPISARIMAIADVYDALRSRRVYKLPIHHQQAVEVILEGAGTHFDPDMVDAFYEVHEEFQRIAHHYADHDKDLKRSIDYLAQAIAEEP
ncbi:putative response regulator rpfG [Crenothrix polyspora]|uniref:Putative response regulator rpfG n=1 Tax=Crenothrix polyspora TaxID=360316 RepID=A0A1R4HHQ7_9GAMM|nr:HD domain-containing phosphohydrolase [Crenothrix polyspora]SJM95753.1 putative response regulator rpfG [Crenothrix polyspora]